MVSQIGAEALTLTFLGTRGETPVRSRRHLRHSSLLLECGRARIMIDCGADWLGRLPRLEPTAIVLTHAHPDHADGLAAGAPCPVYATKTTSNLLGRLPIRDWRALGPRSPVLIEGVRFEAIPVEHSIRAPAVGYRISTPGGCIFYLPDVARLPKAARLLRGVDVYVGDGASLRRPILRRREGAFIGHAPMVEQLRWCRRAGVRLAIFTHCGSQIVRAHARELRAELRRLGEEASVEVRVACDGDQVASPFGALVPRRTRRR